jgi:aspartate racemase
MQTAIFRVKDTKAGHYRTALKKEMKEIGDRLIQKGAQAIVVGCTELSILIHPDDFLVPVFDALTIVARSAIKEQGSHPSKIFSYSSGWGPQAFVDCSYIM